MGEGEPAEYLIERLREAFALDGRVAELDVDVAVTGSTVHLAGAVPTEERRAALEEVARRECPDHQIRNDVVVMQIADTGAREEVD